MNKHSHLRRALSAGALTLALTAGMASPAWAEGPDQDIDENQEYATGRVVLSEGHVDMGLLHRDGSWEMRIHDDTAVPPVWRALDDVVLAVTDAAALPVPAEGFEFLGLEPGSTAYVIPQTEAPGVVWVGWNTQDPGVLDDVDLGLTLRVLSVSGPAEVTVYLQSGSFGEPDVLFTSQDPMPQEAWIELNTHTHANWVFGEPGAYLIDVEFSGTTIAGEEISSRGTLRFAVGPEVDAQSVFDLQSEAPVVDAPELSDNATADGARGGWPWALAGGLGVLLGGAVIITTVRSRAARRAGQSTPVDAP